MKVFFSAGEASGDTYASLIAQELSRWIPVSEMSGVGGRRMEEAGISILASSRTWGAMGIYQSLKVAPRIALAYARITARLAKEKPGLLIAIDFGFFNIRLAKWAKKKGWKVIYFIPPGSWRRDKQGKDLPFITDHIVTPFPWSADLLKKMGASVSFWGHPLAEMVAKTPDQDVREGIALLPGSRMHEVQYNLPAMAEAARQLPGPFRFGVAQTLDVKELEQRWTALGGPPASYTGRVHEVLKSSRAAIVCSGTATLESALCLCPCCVIYRGSAMMNLEYKIVNPKFDFFALPNILAGKKIVEELLQEQATSDNIAAAVKHVLDGPGREAQLVEFTKIKDELSGSRVLEQTAEKAAELLGLKQA